MTTADLEAWRNYRQTRDPAVRDALIEKHLVLVKYAAARIAGRLPAHFRLDDLYSAGLVGFLGAVEDYDPERNVEFAAYAAPRIRGAILDDLRRLDCVPRRVRRLSREATRALATLTNRLGRQPTDEEIAAEMGIELAAYERLLNEGIIGGYDLGRDYADMKDHMLICCTEVNTKEEIDLLVETLREANS